MNQVTKPSEAPVNPLTQPLPVSEPPIKVVRYTSSWVLYNVVVPIAILISGGAVLVALGKQVPPERPPEDQSLASQVQRLPAVQSLPVRGLDAVGGMLDLHVDGAVVPYREISVATEVAGQIVYKDPACEVGSYVEKDQVLIRIDPTDYQNEIDRLEKQKEQEYQSIRELDQEAANTEKLIKLALQDVELQERESNRIRSLPSGVASQAEIDNVQRSRLQALNSKVTLENQLATLRQRRSRLEAAEMLVNTQLEMARTNLQRTEIRAPVSGVIYREDAELNSFVQRGEVVVTVEDTSKVEVIVNLRADQLFWVLSQQDDPSGTEAASVAAGNIPSNKGSYKLPPTKASIYYQIAGREGERFRWDGVLNRYDGLGLDTASRTVPVRIVVDNPRKTSVVRTSTDEEIKSNVRMALVRGMFVNVSLHIESKRPLVVIPSVALKPGSSGSRVWKFVEDRTVLDESKATPALAAEEPATPAQSANTAVAAELARDDEDKFDPSAWLVGRIQVVEQVRPIESMPLAADNNTDGSIALGANGKAVYWVCESADGGLQPGDRLIVSPLASFEGKGEDFVRIAIPKAATPDAKTASKSTP